MLMLIEEARQMLRDMPWAAAAVLVAVVFGMGGHASIFYEADGDELRLVADRNGAIQEGGPALPKLMTRVEQTTACGEKVAGFTVVVGLREYNIELSVPVEGMRSMLESAQMKLTGTLIACKRSVA
jgi:hypothetical protein